MVKQVKIETYPYPSRFGSHKSMVTKGPNNDGFVTCQDEFGEYITYADRLDTGLADPNRQKTSRLDKLFSRSQKEK